MAAAGAFESGDSELEPRLQLLRGHARVSLLARHLKSLSVLNCWVVILNNMTQPVHADLMAIYGVYL